MSDSGYDIMVMNGIPVNKKKLEYNFHSYPKKEKEKRA